MSKKLSRAKILALVEAEANFYGNPSDTATTPTPTTSSAPATTSANTADESEEGDQEVENLEYRAAILRRQRRIAIRARYLLDSCGEEQDTTTTTTTEPVAEAIAEEPVVATATAVSPPTPSSPPMTAAPFVACLGVNTTPMANAQPELTCDTPVAAPGISVSTPPPPPNNDAVAEEYVLMASPLAFNAHSELTFVAGSSACLVPLFVPVPAAANDIPEDPMEVDGPEFQAIDSQIGDQMDIDLFCPALGRELGRLFGFASCRVSGWSVGLKKPTRVSCRFGVRSVKTGALVGGSSMSAKMAIRRRSRLATRHKVGSGSRRVSFSGVGRKTNMFV